MKNVMKNWKLFGAAAFVAFGMVSCGEDGETTPPPSASFTFEVDAENTLMVAFTNASKDGVTFAWDFGDGAGTSAEESPTYTYTEGGTYTVKLTATNDGGSDESTKEVSVIAPSPNLITGGEMDNASDWTVMATDMSETSASFADGQLIFANEETTQTNILVWQAVEVEAGEYVFSANISGAGAVNSWLEINFGSTAPAAGADYTEGLYTGLNTWDGCGVDAFDEDIATLGCKLVDGTPAPGNGQNGRVTFDAAGTIYVVFKAGSWDGYLGAGGIALDNVSLQKAE